MASGPSFPLSIAVALIVGTTTASGQHATEVDHLAVIEIGGAGEWPLKGERPNFGGTLAAEVTPIEDWLELEVGVTALASSGEREISSDLIFKKPFRLAPAVELMAGVGPELSWRLTDGSHARALAAEFALDLMVWPTKNVGWYLEPTYNLASLRSPSGRSLGLTAGLIVGLPWLH